MVDTSHWAVLPVEPKGERVTDHITHLILRKCQAETDWRMHVTPKGKNNGRKVLVNELYPAREYPAQEPEWEPGPQDGKTPVVETGYGGVEIATFTHEAGQDCHKHLIGTEIYTVLEGEMTIRVADTEITLGQGDEVVVFPNTVHEIIDRRTTFLTRVHSINCQGERDKYVLRDGKWCQDLTLEELGSKGNVEICST
jgi:quercetin dioxygenase-like cupin family protein